MADKRNRADKGLDAAGTLVTAAGPLVDLGGTGGAIAGGKLLWDAVSAGIGHRRKRQAKFYLEGLAEALGEEDTGKLAVMLDQAGENEVWETVEEGFRQMMGAIDETAKRCIAVIVADYIVRQELPDRVFRLYGRLLCDSDERILKGVCVLTGQFASVYDLCLGDAEASEDLYSCYSADFAGQREVLFHRDQASSNGPVAESPGESLPGNDQLLLRLLLRSELIPEILSIPEPTVRRSSVVKNRSDYKLMFRFSGEGAGRFRRIHDYIGPVFREILIGRS